MSCYPDKMTNAARVVQWIRHSGSKSITPIENPLNYNATYTAHVLTSSGSYPSESVGYVTSMEITKVTPDTFKNKNVVVISRKIGPHTSHETGPSIVWVVTDDSADKVARKLVAASMVDDRIENP